MIRGIATVNSHKPIVGVAVLFALLLCCGGCSADTVMPLDEAGQHDGGDNALDDLEFITEDEYEILPIGYRYSLSDGYKDVENRYPFVVMVGATVESQRAIHCSGILLTSRLVLTAGHCVCGRREIVRQEGNAHSLIDASRCARTATIETATYTATRDESGLPAERYRSYKGKVTPHPDLEIFLDERRMPLSSQADLAVIALDTAVDGHVPVMRLPSSELQPNTPFIIAGYGLDGRTTMIEGLRRSGWKTMAKPPISGSGYVEFKPYAAAFTTGSGEPCLHQQGKDFMLIGITTLNSVEDSGFTSMYAYREWVLSELRQTRKPAPSLQEREAVP